MKAIVQDTYGSAEDVLELKEIDQPVVKDDKVLIRVHAAGVDLGDWHLMTGLPYLVRIMGFGLRKPKRRIRSTDVAGRVEAVGQDVTQFQPGDEVFGTVTSPHAGLICHQRSVSAWASKGTKTSPRLRLRAIRNASKSCFHAAAWTPAVGEDSVEIEDHRTGPLDGEQRHHLGKDRHDTSSVGALRLGWAGIIRTSVQLATNCQPREMLWARPWSIGGHIPTRLGIETVATSAWPASASACGDEPLEPSAWRSRAPLATYPLDSHRSSTAIIELMFERG